MGEMEKEYEALRKNPKVCAVSGRLARAVFRR